MKICIVISDYYKEISKNLLSGTLTELKKNGYKNIKIKYVSGSIIKGKTDHYYFISQAVTSGLMNLSIVSKKPIGFGILTCNNIKQAKERALVNKKNKGKEVATGIISIIKNL